MSNIYYPDKWVVLNFKEADGATYRKVFASWYGGFTTGDSWKLSSEIESVEETDNMFEFHCCSGSTYYCYKNAQGMSAYSTGIYNYWTTEVKDMQITISMDYTKVQS